MSDHLGRTLPSGCHGRDSAGNSSGRGLVAGSARGSTGDWPQLQVVPAGGAGATNVSGLYGSTPVLPIVLALVVVVAGAVDGVEVVVVVGSGTADAGFGVWSTDV